MKATLPLSGRGKQINYEYVKDGFKGKWGKSPLHIPKFLIDDIIKNLFILIGFYVLSVLCLKNNANR